jgi:hypothetical protein
LSAYRNPHTRWQRVVALAGGMTRTPPTARMTARRIRRLLVAALISSMTGSPPSATLIRGCSGPVARARRTPRTMTVSRSTSTAAGVPRSTRTGCCATRSPSTGPKRRPPDGWPPRPRPFMCPGTRSTLAAPLRRRGCLDMVPSTGCARSTGMNPGTTRCVPKRSIAAARLCTPTPLRTRGCSSDR